MPSRRLDVLFIPIALAALSAPAACRRGPAAAPAPGGDMDLSGPGYIKISGGCECYAEGRLAFTPKADGTVRLAVDNAKGWFYDGNEPVRSYERDLSAAEARDFFRRLRGILDNPRGTDAVSTRAAVIEINMPFKDKTVVTTWRELDARDDVEPLVAFIEHFVSERAP